MLSTATCGPGHRCHGPTCSPVSHLAFLSALYDHRLASHHVCGAVGKCTPPPPVSTGARRTSSHERGKTGNRVSCYSRENDMRVCVIRRRTLGMLLLAAAGLLTAPAALAQSQQREIDLLKKQLEELRQRDEKTKQQLEEMQRR